MYVRVFLFSILFFDLCSMQLELEALFPGKKNVFDHF